jgi:hypothetical protein
VAPGTIAQTRETCKGEKDSRTEPLTGETGIGTDGISIANAGWTQDKSITATTRIAKNFFIVLPPFLLDAFYFLSIARISKAEVNILLAKDLPEEEKRKQFPRKQTEHR